MRIGIDIRYLSHGLVGGVHTYVKHFVPALITVANGHEIFLYADSKRPLELCDLSSSKRVTLRILPWHGGLSSAYHDLFYLCEIMSKDRLDVAHFPANYGFGPAGARTVITLHDEINIMPWLEILRGHPKNLRTVAMMTYLHWCSTAALHRAALVVTGSDYARQQIAHYSGFDPQKIVPVHLAPTPDLRRITDSNILVEACLRHRITKPFILADALKNPAVLIRAWRLLPDGLRRGHQIVFFARRLDPPPILRQAISSGDALLLVNPPREDIVALYNLAEAFVFPSWIEGFGLPVLEAMTCGTPVIASDRGAIPEVAGDAALLMDAEDESTLARHLECILANPAQAESMRQRGYERAAQFSWQGTARQILETYESALETR